MRHRYIPTRRQAALACGCAAVALLTCAGLVSAAALVPAPPVVVPFVVLVCVGCPMLAAWELPSAIAALRRRPEARAIASLRRKLDRLPETEHPLGL
jgi:hypothetical protein